jgi:DNA-binding CsgD family transcriptional regulator
MTGYDASHSAAAWLDPSASGHIEAGCFCPPRNCKRSEIQVLAMLAESYGNKTIAWKLGISEHTAKFHVASILSKLNAGTRTEAVTLGIRRGLILI